MAKRNRKNGPQAVTAPKEETPQPDAKTQAQIEIAQRQAQLAQQAQTAHAVLKAKFADVSVALAIAESERNQLIQQIQSSRQTIEQLTTALAEATAPAEDEKETDDETSEPDDDEDVDPVKES